MILALPTLRIKGLGFYCIRLLFRGTSGIPMVMLILKVWNRPLSLVPKFESTNALPIEEKESYRWIEVCQNTQSAL
jgi:hypothetical protein